ncbi:MAG: hypothetical protein CM1200mP35_00080 [Chloroflexota bacterium]|nr:MAG: hypothetical protein CM1200mP35_00080 [Chloroflexota bacterium]
MPKFSTDTRVDTVIVGGQIVGSSQVYDSSIAIKGEKIVAKGQNSYYRRRIDT